MGNTRRRRVAVLASLGLVSFAFTAVPAIGPASAAPPGHAHASPHLKHAQPLRVNALLDGQDEDNGAPEPSLSALCQSYLGAPNPYGNPAPNVDAIVGDSTVLVGSQAGCAAAQNETTVAVNPANPRNLVAGSNDYRVFNSRENRNDSSGFAYTSLDGGATWTNVVLPHLTFQTGATGALSDMDSAGDPAIAFGPHNTVYYANIAFSRLNDGSAIIVNVSHDGGLTWGEPSIVALDGADASGNPVPTDIFNDKEWVAVDQTSGAAYVSWTRFGPDRITDRRVDVGQRRGHLERAHLGDAGLRAGRRGRHHALRPGLVPARRLRRGPLHRLRGGGLPEPRVRPGHRPRRRHRREVDEPRRDVLEPRGLG